MEQRVTIQLIVGLGNPGNEYANTRHNAGAWLVEALAKDYRLSLKTEPKFNARVALCRLDTTECRVLIPNSYMNLSGQSVGMFAKYYQIPIEAILIAHDELDIAPGEIRLKAGGGHAGHNGLRDIIHHLHSKEFKRLRIGIGHPGNKDDVSDYVLHKPSKMDEQKIQSAIEEAIRILPEIIAGDWQKAMNHLHTLTE